MFKKIRRNFIIIAMCSVSIILLISIGTINIINFRNVDISCDNLIAEINKKLDPVPPSPGNDTPQPGEIGDNSYFVAIYENDKFTIDDENFKVRSIDKPEALHIATLVRNSGSTSGYYNYYRYNVISNRYIFLDATSRNEAATKFLLISIYASLGGLAAFFLLIFFSSKYVLKPVKESYEKQKQFITNASHELKTPLTVISANNELLEMSGQNNEYTANISKEVDKLNKLIKNLIDFSKMSESKALIKTDIDLSKLLEESVDKYKLVCSDIKVKITSKIDKGIKIKANSEIIHQMINIVLDNARKYANKNINISLTKNKNIITLKESNDTSGIENGDLSFYTERFYRSSTSRSSQDGSGIGLSILKELCNNTKTKLKIYGQNNVFNIELIFK